MGAEPPGAVVCQQTRLDRFVLLYRTQPFAIGQFLLRPPAFARDMRMLVGGGRATHPEEGGGAEFARAEET